MQLEAEAQIKKLKEELRLEKDMQLSTTLSFRAGDRVGEQDKLENLQCLTKLRRDELPWIKVQGL